MWPNQGPASKSKGNRQSWMLALHVDGLSSSSCRLDPWLLSRLMSEHSTCWLIEIKDQVCSAEGYTKSRQNCFHFMPCWEKCSMYSIWCQLFTTPDPFTTLEREYYNHHICFRYKRHILLTSYSLHRWAASRLFSTDPLSGPKLAYCWID